MKLLRIQYLEVLHWGLYCMTLIFVRIPVVHNPNFANISLTIVQATTQIVALDRFVYQFIQAYVMSIHKGIVLGFGLQGVCITHNRTSASCIHTGHESQYLCTAFLSVCQLPPRWHRRCRVATDGLRDVHCLRAALLAVDCRSAHSGSATIYRYSSRGLRVHCA